jgi:hypothetical protein
LAAYPVYPPPISSFFVVVVLMTQPEIGNGQHPHDNSGLSSSATVLPLFFSFSLFFLVALAVVVKGKNVPSIW